MTEIVYLSLEFDPSTDPAVAVADLGAALRALPGSPEFEVAPGEPMDVDLGTAVVTVVAAVAVAKTAVAELDALVVSLTSLVGNLKGLRRAVVRSKDGVRDLDEPAV